MYITRDKNKKITGFATHIPQVYDDKKKKNVDVEGYEKISEKSKELSDFQNKTGKYEITKKPVYNTEKMWDILEAEIPALKKYRKSVREE